MDNHRPPKLKFPNATFMCFLVGDTRYTDTREYLEFIETELQQIIDKEFGNRDFPKENKKEKESW